MVKNEEPEKFTSDQLVLDAEPETPEDQAEAEAPTEEESTNDDSHIQIVSLSEWFDSSSDNFEGIRKTTVSIQGVNPDEQMIVTVPIPTEDEPDKRKLVIFNDAHLLPVLNIPAIDMQIYNNGFRIIYDLGGGIFIKSYNLRNNLISVFCNDIDDLLVPYAIVRSKKKDESIEIQINGIDERTTKLSETANFEEMQLRYKQSAKAQNITTNRSAVEWLLARQATIEDVAHHIQIDSVVVDMLA